MVSRTTCLCFAVLTMGLLAARVSASDEDLSAAVEDLRSKVNVLTQQVSSLASTSNQLFSIDHFKYDVSVIYGEQIYIASKGTQNFNLEEMNKLCQASNGFLAEIRDEKELEFLENFVKELGPGIYAIGANDAETEGQFVYYNSKEPMPEGLWMRGEPNNYGGNENCVAVSPWGLTDFSCSWVTKYICQILLS